MKKIASILLCALLIFACSKSDSDIVDEETTQTETPDDGSEEDTEGETEEGETTDPDPEVEEPEVEDPEGEDLNGDIDGWDSIDITEFKITLTTESVEVEADIEYLKLVPSHNNGDADVVYTYNIILGEGEINFYSGTAGDFFYFAPVDGVEESTIIEVTGTTTIGDQTATTSATYTYKPVVFEPDIYYSYYLIEDDWETVHLPLFTGTTYVAFDFYENDPTLPNVLLIGTSISIGYTNGVQGTLKDINNDGTPGKDIANVYRIPQNSNSTVVGVANIDFWLNGIEGKDWDVVHVNFGLHDLKYTTATQTSSDVSIDEYKANLKIIFDAIAAKSKKMIWANTTYYPDLNVGKATQRLSADGPLYNAAAKEVLDQYYPDVPIDDQYTLSYENQSYLNSNDVHFTSTGYAALAAQVCTYITAALDEI